MKCDYCGCVLPADSLFCKKCGATVSEDDGFDSLIPRFGKKKVAARMRRLGNRGGILPVGQRIAAPPSGAPPEVLEENLEELKDLLNRPPEPKPQDNNNHHKVHVKKERRHRNRFLPHLSERKRLDLKKALVLVLGAVGLAVLIAYFLLRYLARQNVQPQVIEGWNLKHLYSPLSACSRSWFELFLGKG